MPHDIESTLASQFDQYTVHGQCHDVPPHAVYEVTVDGRRAVYKCAAHPEGDPLAEASALRFVSTSTSLPVPEVIAAGEDWFVAEWLDGLPDEDEAPDAEEIDASYARALGATMGRLHAGTAGSFDRTGLLDGSVPVAEAGGLPVDAHRDWHATVLAFLERRRAYLADIGYADVADTVLDLLRDRPDVLDGAGEPVVCHGNLLPTHVGFRSLDPTEPAGLIDFEHALVGPAEFDIWRTVLPLFSSVDGEQRETLADFRAGYESVRPLPDGFERRRRIYMLVNMVSYLRSLDLQNRGIGPAEREQAEGMVEWIHEAVADRRENHQVK